MKTVGIVVGDIGSANDIVRVAPVLESRGITCRWFADPNGQAVPKVLIPRGITVQPWTRLTPRDLGAVLVGASATAVDLQIQATAQAHRAQCPVIWYSDFYCTGSRTVTRSVSPGTMLDIDKMAAAISRRVRPDIDVCVVGKPSYAGLTKTYQEALSRRAEIRHALGVQPDVFFVVCWSAGEDIGRAVDQFNWLVSLSERMSTRHLKIALRLHPKLPSEASVIREESVSGVFVNAYSVAAPDLNAAADLVFADGGSTEGLTASLFGTPVVLMHNESDRVKFLGFGYNNGVPPLVEAEVAHAVATSKDFIQVVTNIALFPEIAHRRIKDHIAPFGDLLREDAAERITDEVETRLR